MFTSLVFSRPLLEGHSIVGWKLDLRRSFDIDSRFTEDFVGRNMFLRITLTLTETWVPRHEIKISVDTSNNPKI